MKSVRKRGIKQKVKKGEKENVMTKIQRGKREIEKQGRRNRK